MALPKYKEFLDRIATTCAQFENTKLEKCDVLKYRVGDTEVKYDYVKITSGGADWPVLIIRTGLHGDEIAGPLTIYDHLGEIINYANSKKIATVVYPMDNPSGFEQGTRYNAENDSGDDGNNDFIRYEMEDGRIVPDLTHQSGNFKRWIWSSDPMINTKIPKETLALHQQLKKIDMTNVRGALDLHSDNYWHEAAAYQYVFGNVERYRDIVEKIDKRVKILRNIEIDSGYKGHMVTTDQYGFLVRYDGSLSDLMHRAGVEHSIAPEVTSLTPIEDAKFVNMQWITGIIDLIESGSYH